MGFAACGCKAHSLSIFQAYWQLRSSGWKQEFAYRVVCFVAREGEVSVLNGVAVDAAMWAGIIFANIPGRETAALQAVAFERDCMRKCMTRHLLQASCINTACLCSDSWYKEGPLWTDF